MRLFHAVRPAGLISVFVLALTGCAGLSSPPAVVDAARVQALVEMNWQNPDFVIIDLRSPGEYAEGHIKGARNMPFGTESFRRDIARLDRGRTYVLYCRAGSHSIETRTMMRQIGFHDVAVISGGFLSWKREGFRQER